MENENVARPAPPAPEQPRRPALWVKTSAALLALSIICALVVIMRGAPGAAKNGPGELDGEETVSALLNASKPGIGWINVRGVISESYSSSPFERGAQHLAARIKAMSERKDVKAIVVDINSPGGSVGAVQAVYDEILRARTKQKKPVVALMRDVAASGGYYIAAACDKIVAQPGTLTGSIGVIFQISNVEGLFKKIGVTMNPIKSGSHKDIGSMFRPMTTEEKQILQGVIDDAYSQFCGAVKKGRPLGDEDLKTLADGRVFTGNQALKLKLIDALGGEEEAVGLASGLAKLDKTPRIIRDADPMQRIISLLNSALGLRLPLAGLDNFSGPRLAYLWAY
ncbi:MAG: signal peptide peptidase SppA [Elusimicrobiales bacterium]